MSKSRFVFDKFAKFLEEGLVNYKDFSDEVVNILRSKKEEIILKMNLVSKDEINDIFNLNLTLDLNGKNRQTGNTSLMIFNFNFLIAHLSSYITLMPGDIITTGTPPGVGLGMNPPQFLKDGDEMHLKVDNLGEQKLKVIKEK